MKYLKNKTVTLKDLMILGISNQDGVIDKKKLEQYIKEEKENGYIVNVLGTKYHSNGPMLIDNDDIIYNNQKFKQSFDTID